MYISNISKKITTKKMTSNHLWEEYVGSHLIRSISCGRYHIRMGSQLKNSRTKIIIQKKKEIGLVNFTQMKSSEYPNVIK